MNTHNKKSYKVKKNSHIYIILFLTLLFLIGLLYIFIHSNLTNKNKDSLSNTQIIKTSNEKKNEEIKDNILSGNFKLPKDVDTKNLPSPVSINFIPLKKSDVNDINMAWIATMKKDYQDGKETPFNQDNSRCVKEGRPKGERIYLPEICYMIPFDIRNNSNAILAGDTLLLGTDDVISLIPRYRVNNIIVSEINISNSNGKFNKIPLAGINENSFKILSSMVQEVSSLLAQRVNTVKK